ncbi:tyrosine-type recombinase/integrase [Xylanibacter ruminicola]|uniref:tyrosine-type recombinase/integrase n=1 Tax=Xylanibacter ruminicola TaxID=839 RepID=UPI00048FD242|nr:tyrosine-type recombinase/integrase [Xylanibacter ruminicola]
MALKHVTRKYFQGKVVAYFKRKSGVVRYKLCKIDQKFLTRNLRVKDTYTEQNHESLNKQMDELEERIDNAIGRILYDAPDKVLNNEVIEDYLNKPQANNDISEATDGALLPDFRKYNEIKNQQKHTEDLKNGETRKLHPTMKDYISSANALEDYEYDTKRQYYRSDITEEFLDDFKEWLAVEHIDSEEHKYRCKGDMNNKTINKRLENLAAFIKAYYGDEAIHSLIMNNRITYHSNTKVIVLSLDEVKELYYRELKNPAHDTVRNYFVFLCQTGLRFSDLLLLDDKNFLKQRDGSYNLSYISHKTKVEIEFKLTAKAQEIAKKYNYKFRHYSNQAFNRILKEMLENEGLYEDEISANRFVLGRIDEGKVMRREKISAHTARRTFISSLISKGVSAYQVMNMSGHTKLSTMDIYVEKFAPEVQEATKKIEI